MFPPALPGEGFRPALLCSEACCLGPMPLCYKKWLLGQGFQEEKDGLKLRQWNDGLESWIYVTAIVLGKWFIYIFCLHYLFTPDFLSKWLIWYLWYTSSAVQFWIYKAAHQKFRLHHLKSDILEGCGFLFSTLCVSVQHLQNGIILPLTSEGFCAYKFIKVCKMFRYYSNRHRRKTWKGHSNYLHSRVWILYSK